MHNIRHKNVRAIAGFTLMELLAVVALLAIILAITAPALVPVFRTTEMGRLDATAKEMYVAIQDQFIDMEASGEYREFNKTLEAARSSRNLGSLGAMPTDAEGASWLNFYYLTSFDAGEGAAEEAADAAFQQVVARSAVVDGLTRGGRYIVEVNPRTDGTDVYAVFYSEDPSFTYADVLNLASRERSDRMKTESGYPVGYYCGTAATGATLPSHFAPRASFVNGEELFLHIFCPGGVGLVGAEGGLRLKIVLSDGSHEKTVVFSGSETSLLTPSGDIDLDVVIDSMREGMNLSGEGGIFPECRPGADLNATVEVEYDDGNTTISTPASSRGQAKANSLYAKKVGDTVEVANVRHVNNLRLLSGDAGAVLQVANIDFDATTWGKNENTELSSTTKAYNSETYGTPYVNPIDPRVANDTNGFEPLDGSFACPYNGQGNVLANFFIQGSGPTGLFATVREGQLISNTTLVDPYVVGAGATGALCGELYGQIDSCGVRLNVASAEDESKLDVCFVTSESAEPVGGLVGLAQGSASIGKSFAAINVNAPSAAVVGGLVGSFASSGTISDSYASGAVLNATGTAGGFVGELESGSIENCYTTSDVSSSSLAGGFAGSAAGGTVASSLAYGLVDSPVSGGFTAASGAAFTNCRFLTQAGYNIALTEEQPTGVEGVDFTSLTLAAKLASDHSHPYRASLLGRAFPFAPVLEDHWGNWPEPSNLKPTLVYYERYGTGEYGFYGLLASPEEKIELEWLDESLILEEDGYALISSYPISGFDYSLNGGPTYRAMLGTTPSADTFVEISTDNVYYAQDDTLRLLEGMHAYQLPVYLQMPDRQAASLVDTLEITMPSAAGTAPETYTYYYNPDFAKLVSSPDEYGNTAVPDTSVLYVRTARQLNRLGYHPEYWGATIAQDRDIDFAYYTSDYLGVPLNLSNTAGAYANVPIGRVGDPFVGTYDGCNYAIIDYGLRTEGFMEAGLFGQVSGTVENVHLGTSLVGGASIVRAGSATSGATLAVGGIAGWVYGGIVSGCSVSGYQLFCDASSSVDDAALGGLVGVNQGTVTASSAADTKLYMYAPSASGATLGIGGLVGSTQGDITSSYAVENIFECRTSTSGSGRVIVYGGVAGYAYGGMPAVSDCYGYGFVETTECASNDTVLHYAVSNPQTTTIANCYTMDVYSDADPGSATVVDASTLPTVSLAGFVPGTTEHLTYGETMNGHIISNWSSSYSDNYPYPVICKDPFGYWAHYGFTYR